MNESIRLPLADFTGRGRAGSAPSAALVVEDDPSIREFMRFALSKYCSFVEVAETLVDAEELLARYRFDLLIVDIRLGSASGLDWMLERRRDGDGTPVILMSGFTDDAVIAHAATLSGAELLAKPFSVDQLVQAVERLLIGGADPAEAVPVEIAERSVAPNAIGLDGIIGHSDAMRSLLALIRRVAGRSTTVLLEGESGTGKEVIARCLHHFSGRPGPFVPVNCGSIAAELLESELFGHAKGAFTGAAQAREGLFSYADGGTLLLDEIAEMPLHLQAKLLRVLEERAIRPVGTEREIPVDVRIVAATNRSMAEEVTAGNFREDLYYRLNVLALKLPPLRERVSDIPHLIRLFSNHLSRELALPPLRLSDDEIRQLQTYAWPGNVRELKNLIERSMLLGQSPLQCLEQASFVAPVTVGDSNSDNGYPLTMTLEDVEKNHILKVLRDCSGNKSEAARRLGVSRKTLERKVKAWNASTG